MMMKEENVKKYRFIFNNDTDITTPKDTMIVTEQMMEALGFKNTGTVRGLKEALSSQCSLMAGIAGDDISYVDLIEETIYQPETKGYRLRRRLVWPGGRSAAEETDDIGSDTLHSMLASAQEYLAGKAPDGTITYMTANGTQKVTDMAPFNREQREIIIRCLNNDKDPSILLTLTPMGDPVYDASQMMQILAALTRKLGKAEIDMISNPLLSTGQMRQVRLGLISDNLGIEKVRTYARPDYSEIRMEQIRLAMKDGMSGKVIETLSDPSLDDASILLARLTVLKDMPKPKPQGKITPIFGVPEKADTADVAAFSEETE